MSIYGAMFSGVSGLNAQSQSLGVISDNISNVNTVGYKAGTSRFSTLVTEQTSSSSYAPGGVRSRPFANVDRQGLLQASNSATDIALNGQGFLVVRDTANAGSYVYTRAGSFTTDNHGNLVNAAGYFLQGWPTDGDGVPTVTNTSVLSELQTINVRGLSGTAQATTAVSIKANLPATATVGQTFNASIQTYDSLGVAHNLPLTFTRTATANQWTLAASNPTLATDSSVTTGTTTFGPATVVFNGDGTLASISATNIAVTGWTTGANNTAIALNAGTVGMADGLTQFANEYSVGSIDQDGERFGTFTGLSINDDGLVTAQYDNGVNQTIYKIPVATFANPNGLSSSSGNVYVETRSSGAYLLNSAGAGGAGKVSPASLEASTVDLASEFTNMITTQRAYSAAARIITTADQMLEELVRIGR